MSKFKKFIKESSKSYIYSTIGIVLAIILVLTLNYVQFYVHELGHANSVVLHAFAQNQSSLTINFTYIDFLGKEFLKVPQQTIAPMPKIMFSYGVLFTMVLYAFIFLLVARLKIVRGNKILEYPLIISLITLVLQDIAMNLFCGTDGLRLSCSILTIQILTILFNAVLLLSFGFFFVMLIMFIKNKKLEKEASK
ncbi:hypothetical protein COU58_03485 [Candidatus Pacearchaeota archaeon CG10_big_fil_rev_8_21_14_0_10_32_42]|nr:MAG: hypothetical protein COU58_03485 [Candidatus Pacearchaeota archaeon CG10_big_fil_rev_8_21_14_0_10_32_42]